MRRFSLSHPLPHALALLVFLLLALAAELTAGSGRRSGRTRLPSGVSLHYVERGDPRGRPVIFLHGLSDSWYSFDRVTSLLPSSLRTIALDQRGHGDSERPASGYGMRDLATDVIAFMDAQRIPRATIVGHSMGSVVAQQVAVLAPSRVQKLVLIGAARGTRCTGSGRRRWRGRLRRSCGGDGALLKHHPHRPRNASAARAAPPASAHVSSHLTT